MDIYLGIVMSILLSTGLLPLGEIWIDSSFLIKKLIFFKEGWVSCVNPIPYWGSCQEKGLLQPSDIRVNALSCREVLSSILEKFFIESRVLSLAC